jgi:hypothetical protein
VVSKRGEARAGRIERTVTVTLSGFVKKYGTASAGLAIDALCTTVDGRSAPAAVDDAWPMAGDLICALQDFAKERSSHLTVVRFLEEYGPPREIGRRLEAVLKQADQMSDIEAEMRTMFVDLVAALEDFAEGDRRRSD